ncbi:MAG: hypothetical protein J4432_00770 [DPANN group archaeon]|nr:hypothetical protein [DPANN group archaeon]
MEIEFSELALKQLGNMDKHLQTLFYKHAEKLQNLPPRRHMKFGMPFNVEEVTKQARMLYDIEENTMYITRCFATHKDYEKFFTSYK